MMNNNNDPKPLFPSSSFSSSAKPNENFVPSTATLFPIIGTNNDEKSSDSKQKTETRVLHKFSSYQQEVIDVIDDTSKAKQKELIDLSDSSDSDIQLLSQTSSRKSEKRSSHRKRASELKKKKKHKKNDHYRTKKHKNSDKNRQKSEKAKSDKNDNSYLEFLPRGKALFREDIPNLKPEDAYRMDRRGDSDNRAFGCLYERHVPKYTKSEIIDSTSQKSKFDKQKNPSLKKKRYFYSKRKPKISANMESENFLFPKENLFSRIADQDFIQLSLSIENEIVDQKQSIQAYRFESMRKLDEESRQNDEPELIGPKRRISSHQQTLLELTKEFNKRLNETPELIQTWIDFVRFQDLVCHYDVENNIQNINENLDSLGKISVETGTKHQRKRLNLEKQLEICQKALTFNRKSIRLNLVQMRLLSFFSDQLERKSSEIDKEWKNLCFLFPNAPVIWFESIYYTLRCERITDFRATTRTRKLFREAFATLSGKILEGQFRSHRLNHDIELILINLTSFFVEFLVSIDQTEKALGLFQALIEFNLSTPDVLNLIDQTFDDWFEIFEQFWDSGVPRIGEFADEESDWKHFYSSIASKSDKFKKKDEKNLQVFGTKEIQNHCEDSILECLQQSPVMSKQENILRPLSWLHFERMRYKLNMLPANVQFPLGDSSLVDEIEDPERLVLSDEDLRPFMYRLRKWESKFYLSLKMLQFLGCPLNTFALDSSYSTSRFELEFPIEHWLFEMEAQDFFRLFAPLFECWHKFSPRYPMYSQMFVMKNFGLDDFDSFRLPLGQSIITEYDEKSDEIKNAFIDNTFKRLCSIFKSSSNNPIGHEDYRLSLLLIWIHHKRLKNPKKFLATKKFIKSLLKSNSDIDRLDLYQTYCAYLFDHGNVDESIQTYLATMQAYIAKINNETITVEFWRFTLSLIRCLLNLDSILDQFIMTKVWDRSEEIKFLILENHTVGHHQQIVLRLLVLLITWPKPTAENFQLQQLLSIDNHNAIDVLHAKAFLESIWQKRNDGRKSVEEVHTMIILIYLSQDLEHVQTFFEQEIFASNEVLSHMNFESSRAEKSRKFESSLERSFHLFNLQLVVREYVRSKSENNLPSNKCSLNVIRRVLERALISFPDDPLFLACLVKVESNLTTLTRTRKFFNDYVTSSTINLENKLIQHYLNQASIDDETLNEDHQTSIYSSFETGYNIFMATLHSELLIFERATKKVGDDCGFDFYRGMTNRIRNLFQRALNYKNNVQERSVTDDWMSNRSLAHCPIIWRLFIRFEETERKRNKLNNNLMTSKNKNPIIYQALQMCPNHKPLFMDAILIDPCSLQEYLDTIIDKQLRMRTTIEEVDLLLSVGGNLNKSPQ